MFAPFDNGKNMLFPGIYRPRKALAIECEHLLTYCAGQHLLPITSWRGTLNEPTIVVASTETDSLRDISVLFQKTFYATRNQQGTQKFTSIRFHLISCDLDAIL